MKDNALFTLLKTQLHAGLFPLSPDPIRVLKSYQPSQQGMPSVPTVWLHKIADVRTGFPGVREERDDAAGMMREITTQVMLATFQVSATLITDDDDPQALTAPDVLKQAATVMQSRRFQLAVKAAGANILRIGNITTVDVSGDYAGRDLQPFFEFQINHTDISVTEIPFITRTRLLMARI